jgi:enoyl-[acyl-carrier protein] reductase II
MKSLQEHFNIKYPIIQGGMIWCSGWRLASAVSNAGGLGLIGSGSMNSDLLVEHIEKCKCATNKPFGVNIPLLFSNATEFINICIDQKVPVVFTSAGNPNTWTKTLQDNNIKVAHVVSNVKFALKSEAAGVDAVVAEGFEAGGHNGVDELTTFTLIPAVRKAINIPLIAAGGIASGKGLLAAMALGADGVQIGTRFVASEESSAHINFKRKIIEANENDTFLALKSLTPVRLLKNKFFQEIVSAEKRNASAEELLEILGSGRTKSGMFEGNIDEGELEIGQVINLINEIKPVKQIIDEIIEEFNNEKERLLSINL